ncbi:GDSL-type esterase/lipase family protein [Flavobacterium sp. XS2P12]|uniref:GDSL-type esterase/lipase family protein n=1 Tax=Flavobacterium melibiosi TaxID=3398734 RepID=UPI003A889821
MKNLNKTLILRIALATIFLSHSLHGIFTKNDVNDFGNFLLNKIGFAPFGVALAWIIVLSQVVGSIAFLFNKCIKPFSVLFIFILTIGIVFEHFKEGWFVVGRGRNGMEFSFLLICVLVSLMISDTKEEEKKGMIIKCFKNIKMKRLVFILFFTLTTTIVVGQNTVYDTIQYAREHHQKRLTLFKIEPIVKGKIIFLGNSLTEFGDWQKLLNDTSIINRGIAGDNTFGVINRLEDIINLQPKKIFIEIGINDISQNIPVEIIVSNITSIVKILKEKSPKTKVYVYSILPTNDNVKNNYPDAFNKNNVVSLVNLQLQREAKRIKFTYIDLSTIFKDKKNNLNLVYADSDGLHLNGLGYQTWIKILKSKHYLQINL